MSEKPEDNRKRIIGELAGKARQLSAQCYEALVELDGNDPARNDIDALRERTEITYRFLRGIK